jgi:hypothetical protein
LKDHEELLRDVAQILGGKLVLAVAHPIFTLGCTEAVGSHDVGSAGYLDEGERSTD